MSIAAGCRATTVTKNRRAAAVPNKRAASAGEANNRNIPSDQDTKRSTDSQGPKSCTRTLVIPMNRGGRISSSSIGFWISRRAQLASSTSTPTTFQR